MGHSLLLRPDNQTEEYAMRIEISSVFHAGADRIWTMLCDVNTLRQIARPYAYFTQTSGTTDFHEGGDYAFVMRVFGVLPLGVHSIHIDKWSRSDGVIHSQEHNRYVPVWNHTIRLNEIDSDRTHYTDTVEIEAGWKTPFVGLWARLFYRHRQRKWRRILKSR